MAGAARSGLFLLKSIAMIKNKDSCLTCPFVLSGKEHLCYDCDKDEPTMMQDVGSSGVVDPRFEEEQETCDDLDGFSGEMFNGR